MARNLSEIRKAQRSHAKKRFEQRFALAMNRDRIYEIEKMIASGQAILIESRPRVRNYFVAIEGKLIAVGYNTATKRVVTALPETYLDSLPPDIIHMARFRLLGDESGVISDIINGENAHVLYRQDESVSHYLLRYPGFSFKTGYDRDGNQLVPFVKGSFSGRSLEPPPQGKRFQILELDPKVCQQVRQKIQLGQSRFIWRHSATVTFHAVEIGGETLRAGYSSASKKLYSYEDPTIQGYTPD